MASESPHLYPIRQKPKTVLIFDQTVAFANGDGELCALVFEPFEWLDYALKHDLYVPAGLGMSLINATKRPNLNLVQSLLA
jgi:hypothetical protein